MLFAHGVYHASMKPKEAKRDSRSVEEGAGSIRSHLEFSNPNPKDQP